jgi:hypothetical protein
MTYQEILNVLPESIKERYLISHHEQLNSLMVTAETIGYRCTNSFPIEDIHTIDIGESAVTIRGTKGCFALFFEITIIQTQTF